jgi:hypothetical protein
MTDEEIVAFQTKEKAFYATPLGKSFLKFKLAHSGYWSQDANEQISDRRLRELSDRSDAAEAEFRKLLEAL